MKVFPGLRMSSGKKEKKEEGMGGDALDREMEAKLVRGFFKAEMGLRNPPSIYYLPHSF